MAGRNIAFGVLIGADGKVAIKEFGEVAKGAKKMDSEIEKTAKEAGRSLEIMGNIISGVNAAMQIAGRVWDATRAAMEKSVTASIAQRDETDSQRRAIDKFQESLDKIGIFIGDILVPIIASVAEAFQPTLDAMNEWLNQNRTLVGIKTVEWLVEVSRALISGVAVGANLAAKAWFGWQLIINTTASLASDFFSLFQEGIVATLEGIAFMQDAFGADGLAKITNDHIKLMKQSISVLDNWSDRTDADSAKVIQNMEAVDKAIEDFVIAAGVGLDKVSTTALRRLRESIIKTKKPFKEAKKDADELKDRIDALKKAANEYAGILDDLANGFDLAAERGVRAFNDWEAANERAADGFAETRDKIVDFMTTAANAVRDVFKSAFSDIGRLQNEVVVEIVRNEDGLLEEQDRIVAQHVKTWGDAFAEFFVGLGAKALDAAANFVIAKGIEWAAERATALLKIEANAQVAASGAIAGHSGIPFVGLAIGLGVAAASIAAVLALATFETGGVAVGPSGMGIAGIHGKERVLTERQNIAFERSVDVAEKQQAVVATGEGAGAPQLSVNMGLLGFSNMADMAAQLESSLLPIFQDWLDTGRVNMSRVMLNG